MSEATRRILIAEDDEISRRLLAVTLERMGYDVIETEDGAAAWDYFEKGTAPKLAVLDWMMPEMDGLELCRRIRQLDSDAYTYIVFLTAKGQREDIVDGLEAGADDYLVKPFDPHELHSRLKVGQRILDLQDDLQARFDELQAAQGHVRKLQGLLPICMHCKQIRDDSDAWHQIEAYIEQETDALFTHTLCLSCMEVHYPAQFERKKKRQSTT